MSSTAASNKAHRILACVLCQHRKIKCDRNTPCSNCIKAGVTCVPSTPAPARKRRRPNQDLQERLARCEELLKLYANAPKDASGSSKSAAPAAVPSLSRPLPPSNFAPSTPLSSTSSSILSSPLSSSVSPLAEKTSIPQFNDEGSKWKTVGKVYVEDGSVHFMDNYLWSNIYDELKAMREIVDTDETDDTVEAATPDDNVDLLLNDVSTLNLSDAYPEPVQVFRLWQIFLDRVNPLSKVIHAPSVQPRVVESVTSIQHLPSNVLALLFSIFTMSVVSLDNAECYNILGCSRSEALKKLGDGARAALQRSQILRSFDMTTLQALVLYMHSLQGRYNRHGAWILNGILVRTAQKMGYHRDGTLLNLTPFETEMRRRIWWQIILQDSRYAMMSGLSHSFLPVDWDTQTPSNVNDADLIPGSTEPIQPREGPTEMAFCLFSYEIGKFLVKSHGAAGLNAVVMGRDAESKQNRAEVVKKYHEALNTLDASLRIVEDKYADPTVGQLRELCQSFRVSLLAKIRAMIVSMREQPEWGSEIVNAKDHLFKTTIVHTEHGTENYGIAKKVGFLWFAKLNCQMDVFALMIGFLSYKTRGALVDRAWKQVEIVYRYHDELLDMSVKNNAMLATFVLRAWRAREATLNRQGIVAETPAAIFKLREIVSSGENSTTEGTPPSISSDLPNTSFTPPPNKAAAPDVPMGGEQGIDQFLGGFIDINALDWDSWGGDMATAQAPDVFPAGQGFTGFGGLPPTGGW